MHRTYARALFEAAKEQGRLRKVAEELGDFAAAVGDVPELRAVLRNPELDPETKGGIVAEIIGDADPLLGNFLRLVAEKGRSGEIADIARELDRLMAAEEGRLDVELTTAYELSEPDASSDFEADPRGVGPQGRSDAESRSQSDRRFRPAGRLHACRRVRSRPNRALAP